MRCKYVGNKVFKLENGDEIVFLNFVNSVKGNQYFVAKDNDNNENVYYIVRKNQKGQITEIEKVR
jgi:hypothetical protein